MYTTESTAAASAASAATMRPVRTSAPAAIEDPEVVVRPLAVDRGQGEHERLGEPFGEIDRGLGEPPPAADRELPQRPIVRLRLDDHGAGGHGPHHEPAAAARCAHARRLAPA